VDEKSDLALLRLEEPGHPALALAGEAERSKVTPPNEGEGPRLTIAGYAQPVDGTDADSSAGVRRREGVLIADRTDDGVQHMILGPTPDVGPGWSGGPLFPAESGKVVGVFHALIARKTEPGVWFPQSISVAQVEALLRQAGVTDLAPFRAPPSPTMARAAHAGELFRHEYRASALAVTRKWVDVEAECRAILKRRPESARAYNTLAVALGEQEKGEEALVAFTESLRLDPERASTHMNRALVLQKLKRLEEAESALRKAIELSADDPNPWIALGRVLTEQGRRDEATEALRKAVQVSPSHPLARWNLGLALVRSGDTDGGIVELREAVALAGSFQPLRMMRFNLAQLLHSSGQLDAAEAEYRGIVQSMEENPAAHLLFATFLRSRGKSAEALTHARRCLELKPPAELEAAAKLIIRALEAAGMEG
jgi:tetratricopeptide (TPR) repeat protein